MLRHCQSDNTCLSWRLAGIKASVKAVASRDWGWMVNTSNKVLRVLQLFTPARPEWTVDAAAGELGFAQSTAYEYFRTLAEYGLIASVSPGRYILGPAVFELDMIARRSDPLLLVGRAALEAMVEQPPAPIVALLCRLYKMKVMCIDQRASTDADFAVSYERGRLMPLFRGSASKVILANIERRRLRRIFEENRSEVAKAGLGSAWEEFRSTLRRIKAQDFCVTRGELDSGRLGLSAPLLTYAGESLGSLSLVVCERTYDRSEDVRRDLHARLTKALKTFGTHAAGAWPATNVID